MPENLPCYRDTRPESDLFNKAQRFLSDHAATGVSPKDWCEAQGLNYATARRYIKKPTAQTAQKPAQKKLRTAQKEKCAEELVEDDGLTHQQRLFVAEYLKDNNATQAAIRAGYSKKTANEQGARLLAKVSIAQAIAQQQKASIVRTLGSADEVLEQMWRLATFDANQLSQYRRGSCRYCWGFGHQYQWRDAVEFEEKLAEALAKKGKEPNDRGGYRVCLFFWNAGTATIILNAMRFLTSFRLNMECWDLTFVTLSATQIFRSRKATPIPPPTRQTRTPTPEAPGLLARIRRSAHS